jgi:hypothetical protein
MPSSVEATLSVPADLDELAPEPAGAVGEGAFALGL